MKHRLVEPISTSQSVIIIFRTRNLHLQQLSLSDPVLHLCRCIKKVLTDDEVDHLVLGSILRKPGGTIERNGAQVAHPGFSVSYIVIKQLKLMNYYLRFMEKTSRNAAPADITEQNIHRMMRYREWEEGHKDPEEPELSFKDTQWARAIETLEEYFHNCLGTTKIPLSYIVRDDANVPDSANDPPTTSK